MTRYLRLGASLYVPATRDGLVAIGNGHKYPFLRSMIFCTEDAVHAADVPFALDNLAAALHRFESADVLRFVRVRNPDVLKAVLSMDGACRLSGFVLPKVTVANLDDYFTLIPTESPYEVMPTLETAEVFDPAAMRKLRARLAMDHYRRRVLALRIGGNDLMNLLGLRRPAADTIYDTPLALTIAQLVTTFRPHGFHLTAPVFEALDRPEVLAREVERDLGYGMFGKTAIHPGQVPVIEARYRVRADELHAADRILDHGAAPVFRLHGSMCEPATHRAWAELVRERAAVYGVTRGAADEPTILSTVG